MSISFSPFNQDIVLDDQAFATAAADFEALSGRLEQLRRDVEEMINTLKTGYDTPAGRKFIASCERNLFAPLDDQKLVLDHISATLRDSRQAYDSVFREYNSLQSHIQSIDL